MNISFVVNKLFQFMHVLSINHCGGVKRLLRYLNGTRSLGIQLLADTPLTLHGFPDADWASNPDDRTSTNAFLIFLGVNMLSKSSTKQIIVACSSTDAEYQDIAVAVVKMQLVKSLLSEILAPMLSLPTLFSDNLDVAFFSANPVFHSRMKYLAIDYHFVRDLVQSLELCVVHVSTDDQFADALTKSLSRSRLFSHM